MAYYNNQSNSTAQGMNGEEDEEKKQSAGAPSIGAVQPASGAPAAGGAMPAAATQAPASSGMGAGFSQYAKANQGQATNRLANAAQSNVQNIGQQAKTSINQAQSSFAKKVDQGSLANRHQAIQDVANAVQAARQITAPVPSAVPAPTGAAQAPTAPLVPGLEESQVNRFKDVINAKYAGPESMRQGGMYQQTAKKVGTAQTALDNIKSAQGRHDLLRSMYENRGNYTRGQNTLDSSLLNASKQGVAGLQNTAKQFGNLQTTLDQANISASNMAQNRAREIQDIQAKARDTFTQGKTAEEAATEGRLDKVQADWDKLPQYLRDTLAGKHGTGNQQAVQDYKQSPEYLAAQKEAADLKRAFEKIDYSDKTESSWLKAKKRYEDAQKNLSSFQNQAAAVNPQTVLSQEEADLLGFNVGDGLYGMGPNAIKTAAVASRDELISRDEQARQAALAALAGFDQSNQLDTNLKYADANKAGTKSAFDAYDKEATRRMLTDKEKAFQASAASNKFDANRQASYLDTLKNAGYNTSTQDAGNLISKSNLLSGINTTYGGGITGQFSFGSGDKKNFDKFLTDQKFENRVNVQDNPALQERTAALQAFLNSLDQTNKKQG